jgi:putative membrane protein
VSLRSVLLAVVVLVLVWSAIAPHDYFTWLLEVFPALIGIVLAVATRHRFPLTPLLYIAVAVHAVVLAVGGHYTYAEVPFGFWMSDVLGFERNHYDRIGHFLQGFVPAILTREILIRLDVVPGRRWLAVIVVAICTAVSALYELLEFSVAILIGEQSEAFLGTQGDVWDTHKDMGLAFIGAMIALAILGRLHDRQLAAMESRSPARNRESESRQPVSA